MRKLNFLKVIPNGRCKSMFALKEKQKWAVGPLGPSKTYWPGCWSSKSRFPSELDAGSHLLLFGFSSRTSFAPWHKRLQTWGMLSGATRKKGPFLERNIPNFLKNHCVFEHMHPWWLMVNSNWATKKTWLVGLYRGLYYPVIWGL